MAAAARASAHKRARAPDAQTTILEHPLISRQLERRRKRHLATYLKKRGSMQAMEATDAFAFFASPDLQPARHVAFASHTESDALVFNADSPAARVSEQLATRDNPHAADRVEPIIAANNGDGVAVSSPDSPPAGREAPPPSGRLRSSARRSWRRVQDWPVRDLAHDGHESVDSKPPDIPDDENAAAAAAAPPTGSAPKEEDRWGIDVHIPSLLRLDAGRGAMAPIGWHRENADR